MKHLIPLPLLLLLCLLAPPAAAQQPDSVDVDDCHLRLDLSQGAPFRGVATLTLQLTRPCATLSFLLAGVADSITVDGQPIPNPDLGHIPVATLSVGTPFQIAIWYHGSGHVESYGWGGFHFDSDMTYNLGVAFGENPHPIGRALFPCRDNFTDKATYTLEVTTRQGWTAQCGGEKLSATIDSLGCEHSVWRIGQPVPSYLVSVSQADYHVIDTLVASRYGTYPLTLGYTTQDSASVAGAFALLHSVVPMFENCLGPYRWGRIGYIPTKQGSMEHVNNIALAKSFMASTSLRAQSTIAHELGHAWFGNLITCATEGDMWINEGGASFCSELAREATHGRASADAYYQQNLESVVRTTHIADGAYLPLSGMPHSLTYGSTTYDKGALVWHSMRGYLGDSLFYASLSRLMANAAFGNIDAYGLRDSMSLYSGTDLTDFFDFHVFNPGFVDYHLQGTPSNEGAPGYMLSISQQGIGTTARSRSNRVPVRLWTWEGDAYDIVLSFRGPDTIVALGQYLADHYPMLPADLASHVAFPVLDPACALSDAATYCDISLPETGQKGDEAVHIRLQARGTQQPVRFFVEHHWGQPYGLGAEPGIVRTAQRYWVAHSLQYGDPNLTGLLRFSCANATNTTYSGLDREWLFGPATLDSVVVLYRPDARSPWQAVSHRREGGSDEGFFVVSNFRDGEYTLAVADTALLSIADPAEAAPQRVDLFPNPVPHGSDIVVNLPGADTFGITLIDAQGRTVWSAPACRSGQPIGLRLSAGAYTALIHHHNQTFQSKIIQL